MIGGASPVEQKAGRCYDAKMEVHARITKVESADWNLRFLVRLDRREIGQLYLMGDRLISWPQDGLSPDTEAPLVRTSLFLSELAARREGLDLHFTSQETAALAQRVLERQVRQAFEDTGATG